MSSTGVTSACRTCAYGHRIRTQYQTRNPDFVAPVLDIPTIPRMPVLPATPAIPNGNPDYVSGYCVRVRWPDTVSDQCRYNCISTQKTYKYDFFFVPTHTWYSWYRWCSWYSWYSWYVKHWCHEIRITCPDIVSGYGGQILSLLPARNHP
jgi:hypothetical protein